MSTAITFPGISVSDNTIRRALMVLLAFLMTHLISYQQLPFTSGYKFPLIPFLIFIIYGIFICETNTWNYRRLKIKNSGGSLQPWKIIRTNITYCAIIFIVLTLLQMIIFQYVMNPFRFVGLLSICLMISMIETGVFILQEYKQEKKSPLTLHKLAKENPSLSIVRNNLLINLAESDIYCFTHENGCIFITDREGRTFSTQFESLNDLENELSNHFFRATRRHIISRTAIQAIEKDVNFKLKVFLRCKEGSITISRYKSRAFKDWYKS